MSQPQDQSPPCGLGLEARTHETAQSLCCQRVLTSQFGLRDEQLDAAGVTRGMLRRSSGIEHRDDLLADLQQALG